MEALLFLTFSRIPNIHSQFFSKNSFGKGKGKCAHQAYRDTFTNLLHHSILTIIFWSWVLLSPSIEE